MEAGNGVTLEMMEEAGTAFSPLPVWLLPLNIEALLASTPFLRIAPKRVQPRYRHACDTSMASTALITRLEWFAGEYYFDRRSR